MSIERYVELIPQTTDAVPQQLPIERGTGNFLLFQLASAVVTVTLLGEGVREVFSNIQGGLYVKRLTPWKNLRIDGAVGTSVTYFIGNEKVDRDDTDIRLQTTIIAGVTATAAAPAASVTALATVPVGNAAQVNIFPQNLTRRRISFSLPSNQTWAANTVFARKIGDANNLFEVQPGVLYNDEITFGLDIRNDSGSALTVMRYEVS